MTASTFSKLLMELIGTAALVFTIQVSVGDGSTLAPVAIGAVLITIVFAGGPISGAHYNPAISLAILLRGKMSFGEMIEYWISQVIGGYAGGLLGGIVGSTFSNIGVGEGYSSTQALLAEVIFTFLLCFVVLASATNSKAEDNHYYGLAIGLVVASGAITVGPISGGAFNPAVALGLCISKGFDNLFYVLFVSLANLVGGIVAAVCFYAVAPEEHEKSIEATIGEQLPLNRNVV